MERDGQRGKRLNIMQWFDPALAHGSSSGGLRVGSIATPGGVSKARARSGARVFFFVH